MLRGLLVDRVVDLAARVTTAACFIALWGAVLAVSARSKVVRRLSFLPA